jgi:hypothetical protein
MVLAVAARPLAPTSFSAVAEARAQASETRRKTRLADAKQAIETLKSARVSSRDVQKEMARRKLDEIKERIRMLKMTASMDPAGAARQIAALARDLAGAIKAYSAAAGQRGTDAGDPGARAGREGKDAASAEASGQVVSASTAPSGGTDAPGIAADALQSQPALPAAPASLQTPVTGDGAKDPGSEGGEGSRTERDPAALRASELYRQIQSSPERAEREKGLQVRKAEAKDAEDFMREVRDLAKTLKDILQKIAEAAKAGGKSGAQDVEDAEKSLGQLAQEIGFATATLPTAPIAVAA